jgi:hypothetical protein
MERFYEDLFEKGDDWKMGQDTNEIVKVTIYDSKGNAYTVVYDENGNETWYYTSSDAPENYE